MDSAISINKHVEQFLAVLMMQPLSFEREQDAARFERVEFDIFRNAGWYLSSDNPYRAGSYAIIKNHDVWNDERYQDGENWAEAFAVLTQEFEQAFAQAATTLDHYFSSFEHEEDGDDCYIQVNYWQDDNTIYRLSMLQEDSDSPIELTLEVYPEN